MVTPAMALGVARGGATHQIAELGDPAVAPIPIWCWWARYTARGEPESELSAILRGAVDLPTDAEATISARSDDDSPRRGPPHRQVNP